MSKRAYSPNLRTAHRASAAARTLGITGWHIFPGPDLVYTPAGAARWVRRPLAEIEAEAHERHGAGRQERPAGCAACDREAEREASRGWDR